MNTYCQLTSFRAHQFLHALAACVWLYTFLLYGQSCLTTTTVKAQNLPFSLRQHRMQSLLLSFQSLPLPQTMSVIHKFAHPRFHSLNPTELDLYSFSSKLQKLTFVLSKYWQLLSIVHSFSLLNNILWYGFMAICLSIPLQEAIWFIIQLLVMKLP